MSIHNDLSPKATMAAGVSGAARRAIYVLCHKHHVRRKTGASDAFPSGKWKTFIAPTPAFNLEMYVYPLTTRWSQHEPRQYQP